MARSRTTALFPDPSNLGNTSPLNYDLISHIGTFLDKQSLGRLSEACGRSYRLFQNTLNCRHLLQHVMRGEQGHGGCDLVFMSTPPQKDTLDKLPIQSNAAYIRCGKQLFYINKVKRECTEIKINDKKEIRDKKLKIFDEVMKPAVKAKTLSENELGQITSITDHVPNAESLLLKLKMAKPKDYWRIVLQKAKCVEGCDRQWQSVSPLEFAAWAGDTSMVEMLLSRIPDEHITIALEQLRGVKKNGTEHGAHLSYLKPVIEAYEEYAAKFASWNDWKLRDWYWVKEIGGRQKKHFPAVMLQEFCGPIAFSPLPEFKQAPVRSCFLSNGTSLLPYSVDSRLGVHYALFKSSRSEVTTRAGWSAFRSSRGPLWSVGEGDLAALRHFYEVRTADLDKQISRLEQLLEALRVRLNTPLNIISTTHSTARFSKFTPSR